ncbi:hypothetical protein Xish_02901 [Xenorhabdus ishibashii]|uniref:Uncharacterized protein n=1 Tax=Xenorhabdus ishibashii TaxID=1034471 RepID=A0A2D0KJZ5_9GAMM|nr:hypothetical protein Xish_02901 [Xenorhabdus ishibashii]
MRIINALKNENSLQYSGVEFNCNELFHYNFSLKLEEIRWQKETF